MFGRLNNQLVDGGQYKAESEEKRTGVSFIEQGGRIFHIGEVISFRDHPDDSNC